MYKFFKKYEKHQKKLLAIFSVGLMIVFALPTMMQNGGQGDYVAAKVLNHDVMASTLQGSSREWDYLTNGLKVQGFPAAALLGRQYDLTGQLFQTIRQHPDMYYLLVAEAHDSGASVNQDDLHTLEGVFTVDPADEPSRNQALSDVLLINDMLARMAALPKVSAPQVQHQLVNFVGLSLNVIAFDSKDYAAKAPPPTPGEIDALYDKYKDSLPDSNPYGFSYRVPDRVKIEYLAIDRGAIRKAIEPTVDEIEAREYYHTHESSFTTRPSTGPASFDLGAFKSSDVGPTITRPFDEVRDEVYQTIIADKTDAKVSAILQDIENEMSADYGDYAAAVYPHGPPAPTTEPAETVYAPATQPAPASSVGVAYTSPDYLPLLAQHIQQRDGVLPTVTTATPWLTPSGLEELPGIGQSSLTPTLPELSETATPPSIPMYKYAINYVRPLAGNLSPTEASMPPHVLSLLEPSQTLKDDLGNRYLFRVTGVDPAHAPAQIDVFHQLDHDARYLAALKLARDAAQKVISDLGEHHLQEVAQTKHLSMMTTGLFDNNSDVDKIAGLPSGTLTAKDQDQFMNGAHPLLTKSGAGVDANHPVGIIELALSGKVLVAEINEVQPIYWHGEDGLVAFQYQLVHGGLYRVYGIPPILPVVQSHLLQDWLQWDAITARTNYHATEKRR